MERFYVREYPNGLTLVGQSMDHVSSAAVSLLVPAGAAHDPPGAEGAASVITEWCLRGAGARDSRQLALALDALGCHHSQSVFSEHMQFSSIQLGRNLTEALGLLADILRRPRLADACFEPCRQLTVQDLQSLEDEPARKCSTMLRERFYPHPLGRCAYGREDSLRRMVPEEARRHARQGLTPRGAILGAAGRIDWAGLCAAVEAHFGDWPAGPARPIDLQPPPGGVSYVPKDCAQTHIALAHPSVTPPSPHYYAARLAEGVLSGGMSSRLFVEVREKRGLAYHASCRYHCLKDHAGLFTYVGAEPRHAQQALEVAVGELRRLAEGIDPDELARSRTQLKSALVMQGESTVARAGALVADWYHLHRLRSLQEVSAAVDAVSADDVTDYLRCCPARGFVVLVIGPAPLDVQAAGAGE